MAMKPLPKLDQPGHSMPSKKGTSNLPANGLQSGPNIGFGSGGKLGKPKIKSTGGLTDFVPGHSSIPTLKTGRVRRSK